MILFIFVEYIHPSLKCETSVLRFNNRVRCFIVVVNIEVISNFKWNVIRVCIDEIGCVRIQVNSSTKSQCESPHRFSHFWVKYQINCILKWHRLRNFRKNLNHLKPANRQLHQIMVGIMRKFYFSNKQETQIKSYAKCVFV